MEILEKEHVQISPSVNPYTVAKERADALSELHQYIGTTDDLTRTKDGNLTRASGSIIVDYEIGPAYHGDGSLDITSTGCWIKKQEEETPDGPKQTNRVIKIVRTVLSRELAVR